MTETRVNCAAEIHWHQSSTWSKIPAWKIKCIKSASKCITLLDVFVVVRVIGYVYVRLNSKICCFPSRDIGMMCFYDDKEILRELHLPTSVELAFFSSLFFIGNHNWVGEQHIPHCKTKEPTGMSWLSYKKDFVRTKHFIQKHILVQWKWKCMGSLKIVFSKGSHIHSHGLKTFKHRHYSEKVVFFHTFCTLQNLIGIS